MGLAASQARFLNLTSRQHNLEHRAQFLQASKLRLANDSDTVYNKYIDALDATKLETKIVKDDKKVHWVDGSLQNLMGYTPQKVVNNDIYFAQNIHNGKIYVENNIATNYDNAIAAGGDIYDFYDQFPSEITYTKDVYSAEYLEAKGLVDYDKSQGWDVEPYSTDPNFLKEYTRLKANTIDPVRSITADLTSTKARLYEAADIISDILNYVAHSDKLEKDLYLPAYENELKSLQTHIATIRSLGSSYITSDIDTILKFCENFNLLPDSDKENISKVDAQIQGVHYLMYDKDKLEDAKEENIYITDKDRIRLLLNGGVYSLNEGANQDIYDTATQTALENYTIAGLPNIGDALKQFVTGIKDGEIEKERTNAQTAFNNLLTSKGTTESEVEDKLAHHKKYLNDLAALHGTPEGKHTEFNDPLLAQYYETVFNALNSAGGYIIITATNAKDGDWVHNMIKSAQVVLAKYNPQEDGYLDSVTPSTSPSIREVSNKKEIERANVEYETALDDISEKERKYNIELNKLEGEYNAINIEIESLKKIAKENVERTFKLFS